MPLGAIVAEQKQKPSASRKLIGEAKMMQSKRLRASFLVSTALITDNGGIILLMQSRSAVRESADEGLSSDVKIQWPGNPQITYEEPYIVYFDYTQGQC